jgi:hypothetical protein
VVTVPLPVHYLPEDGDVEQRRQSIEAMESLARALLDFADRIQRRSPL